MSDRLFLLDVDDTLVESNTTFGFISRVMSEDGSAWERARWGLVTDSASPVRVAVVAAERAGATDLARDMGLKLLKGRTRDRLGDIATEYARTLIDRHLRPQATSELTRAREEGERVILTSAGLSLVVGALARELDVDFRASELEFEAGRATGRLAVDLTGRKGTAVGDEIEVAEHLTVMTDNLSDRALVARADRRVVVLLRERNRSAWADLSPEFVEVAR